MGGAYFILGLGLLVVVLMTAVTVREAWQAAHRPPLTAEQAAPEAPTAPVGVPPQWTQAVSAERMGGGIDVPPAARAAEGDGAPTALKAGPLAVEGAGMTTASQSDRPGVESTPPGSPPIPTTPS
jgi:hypothetical protein